ncbi:ExbD/TolR family protein [Prevotella multiformis]|jgi:membrane protein|uniref:Transport energizing protein, ExbD/TolR family n=1 Tax=Prevotella multiformis DSM 16608 TaxID=888743 RepID=F0F6V1_9BACT|nr:biopolymer transporter ExbD [Prevotella multiformis]EGC20078.1 transport energizing protein, ExbD/TolR family [Prevotella multiformis DSM 16608]QUB70154.1 biopolymer transporter ExbD [Prevotella multiformis]
MMFRRREKRKVPGLNTTSTADISFMLLILFLVASSMDLDKGLARRLPAIDKTKKTALAVDSRKVIRLVIGADDKVTLDGRSVTMRAIRQQTTTFVKTNGKGHLIQLQTDRKASYDTYLHVQDQLAAAYNAVRDQRSSSLFGKPFEQCSREQQTRIADEVPVRISEVYAAAAGKTGKGGGR